MTSNVYLLGMCYTLNTFQMSLWNQDFGVAAVAKKKSVHKVVNVNAPHPPKKEETILGI